MKKINVTGLSSLIGGACLFGYHELSVFMSKSGNLKSYSKSKTVVDHKSLYDILDEGNFEWIDSLPWGKLREGADYLVTMPLWLLLVIIGSILLIIGGIIVKK